MAVRTIYPAPECPKCKEAENLCKEHLLHETDIASPHSSVQFLR